MNCRSLRWLTQLLTSLILIASVRPSSSTSTCPVLPTIAYVTSTVPQIGDTVVLNCSFTGDQNGGGGVSWTKDSFLSISSTQLGNPCTCFSQSNGVSGNILFVNVSNVDTDYGVYTCTAQVGFGDTCINSVTVQKPVPPVLLAVGSTSQTANQSSTVTFSVSLTNPGTPLASVVWSKNGVPLSNTSNMVVTSTMLQLSNIQAGDRGQYVVTATNKAGSSNISFSLFVQFIIVTINRDASGMVTCTAMSYPGITTLLLKDTTSQTIITTNSNILNNFTYQAITMLPGSADCSQQYSCDGVVTLAAMMTITNGTVDRCAPVSNPMLTFKPVGYNGMFIQWSPAAGSAPITYMIRYRVSGTSPYLEAPPILCGTVCNTTVTGLTLGETYGFSVGMFPEQSVVAMQGLAPVTGVVAIPSSSYVTISWNKVPRATGYLILISQGTNSSFIQNVTMATNSTSVPGLTCGALYTFKVQAYNALNLSSPSPSDGIQTTNYCSSSPGILSATADGTIVKVTLFNLNSVMAVKITVTSDSGMVYYYNPSSLGASALCLGGLSQGTLFTVCASFYLEAGYAVDDCYAQKVLTGVGTSSLLCGQFVMNPSGTIAGPTSETAGVQPWIIGVLVVGLLGLVATIFCVMGMYLACRPDKTDQANFGSSLSLDTATSPNSQTHNPSFKAVSPPRNCLSRSTKSHNISWKDQMDTIRQLETNGTNV